jgi:HPt (histidine-containing phosphotransfer) domain-containing protein
MAKMLQCIRSDSGDRVDAMQVEGAAPLECDKLLEEWSDNPQFIRKILNSFIRETQTDIDTLAVAFDSHDAGRAVSTSHRLKGAAATIGAEPLRAEAARIEALGRKGQLMEALDGVTRLRVEFERFCSYVSRLPLPPAK